MCPSVSLPRPGKQPAHCSFAQDKHFTGLMSSVKGEEIVLQYLMFYKYWFLICLTYIELTMTKKDTSMFYDLYKKLKLNSMFKIFKGWNLLTMFDIWVSF